MACKPTKAPTKETCDEDVVSNPTMETCSIISHVPTNNEPYGVISHVPTMSFPVAVASANSFKVTRAFGGVVENAKVNVPKLYLHQVFAGWNVNQSEVIKREGRGQTLVNYWRIYDSPPGPQARLVATTHGMHTHANKWYHWFNLEFEVERFKGSTLQVMGANNEYEVNEWAIVGGTGEFAMARGIINRRVYSFAPSQVTQELSIEFFCRIKEVPAPTKRGTVGGNTGSVWEMEGKSQRLENVTIYHHGAVEGFQFSYIDEDGQIRITDTWGKISPVPANKTEIKFGPSEFVKQIKGAKRGDGWLSKFEIVTTHKTYGPFGFGDGHPYFNYTVPEGETVVGFFAKTDNSPSYVTTIGVYTI